MVQVSKCAIPRLKEFVQMDFGDLENLIALVTAKPLDKSEFQWIKPEFGGAIISLNMNVRRLKTVGHVEKEAISALTKNSWHTGTVASQIWISRRV
jgi:hypothetical protein